MSKTCHGKIAIGSMVFSASQTGTLYGCGYKTMLQLFDQFNGKERDESEISEQSKASMEFGTFFEEPVAQFVAKKLKVRIKKCGETAYWKADLPYFICHPDRLVIGKDSKGRRAAIEVKCVSPFAEGWGEEGTDQIPLNYFFQVQSYYACGVPCDVVYVACLRGNRVYIYEILPDKEIIADIRKRVRETHDAFEKGLIPNLEGYTDVSNFYGRKIDMESEGTGANDEVLAIYAKLSAIHAVKAKAESKEKDLKVKLIELLDTGKAFVNTNEKGKVETLCGWQEKEKKGFDLDALKADHPEIDFAAYNTTTKTREFRVNFPRAKKEEING